MKDFAQRRINKLPAELWVKVRIPKAYLIN